MLQERDPDFSRAAMATHLSSDVVAPRYRSAT